MSVCFQGYERVRRNSEEEVYLMRAHDMEEGNSHSDLSSSGEHHTEEVSTLDTTEYVSLYQTSVTLAQSSGKVATSGQQSR